MSYSITFEPILEDDGTWEGQTKVMMAAHKPDTLSMEDHIAFLTYIHRISVVGSFWEEHLDEFIDYNVWYQNNVELPNIAGNLQ